MFRDLARKNKQLSHGQCIEILKNEQRGVLSVLGDNGYPYGMPLNHWYNEEDGALYFHSGKSGHKIDAVKNCGKVSFCTYDGGYRNEGEWALNIKSVIVFGKIEIIEDADKIIDIMTKLCRKFTQDEEYIKNEIEMHTHSTILLRLIPEHICGKAVTEA